MIYKDFQGLKLSALGFGTMRLPTVNGRQDEIDQAQLDAMVDHAMAKGVNYYDTAWGYHDGASETAVGKSLSRYPRESWYLADKFPGYDLGNIPYVKEIFEKQLEKLNVSYFDFYLVHDVCEKDIEQYLDPKYGIYDYLTEQKRNGRIKHLGFSVHGNLETTRRFLEVYGKDMEFCQIQLNWLDYSFQSANAKLALLKEWLLAVWVMEPLRGGSLLSLAEEHRAKLSSLRPDWKPLDWGFRYLQSFPEVTVTLSGMSDLAQMQENIAIFETERPLTQEEMNALQSIAAEMTSKKTLPCTKCRYCTAHCPQQLDIPWLLELYNEHVYSGGGVLAPMAVEALPEDRKPSACLGCRACEAVCPQSILISEAMADFAAMLEKA
ncbi:MAG: aldo/keto reductase [Oscillospiraceae bacterium]|nr:aldo/keto reductase [Oscillospiraceae bacterium]